MRESQKQNVKRILIPESNMVYNLNGVFYLVKSKFHEGNEHNIQSRFGRLIENISPAHLTGESEDDKIKAEYVLDTAGEEDYADQNEKEQH